LLVNILSPQVHLNFYVPKADMRNPPEVPVSEFVAAFWTRTVHPEIFQIDLVNKIFLSLSFYFFDFLSFCLVVFFHFFLTAEACLETGKQILP
jgi:hypothetical protein